jgi:hypothetical protein
MVRALTLPPGVMRSADPLERPHGSWQAERSSLRGGGERVRPPSSEALVRVRCLWRQRVVPPFRP